MFGCGTRPRTAQHTRENVDNKRHDRAEPERSFPPPQRQTTGRQASRVRRYRYFIPAHANGMRAHAEGVALTGRDHTHGLPFFQCTRCVTSSAAAKGGGLEPSNPTDVVAVVVVMSVKILATSTQYDKHHHHHPPQQQRQHNTYGNGVSRDYPTNTGRVA